MTDASVALNRFGLGARPDEQVPTDAKRWLLDQLGRFNVRPAAIAAPATSATVAAELADHLAQTRQARQAMRDGVAPAMTLSAGAPGGDAVAVARRFARRQGQDFYATAVAARTGAALTTLAPFVERLVQFWANHFAVSADKLTVVGLAPTLEFEAIPPHVLGRFGDMLTAVERHPAMLLYLDQAQSVGPASPLGSRAAAFGNRQLGLNENLAREILELHTVGVRTGYTEGDVTEFARARTGWTVVGLARGGVGGRLNMGPAGSFLFAPALHEPGARMIMGRRYDQAGEAQASAVLADLATHSAAATRRPPARGRRGCWPANGARVAMIETGGGTPTRSSVGGWRYS